MAVRALRFFDHDHRKIPLFRLLKETIATKVVFFLHEQQWRLLAAED